MVTPPPHHHHHHHHKLRYQGWEVPNHMPIIGKTTLVPDVVFLLKNPNPHFTTFQLSKVCHTTLSNHSCPMLIPFPTPSDIWTTCLIVSMQERARTQENPKCRVKSLELQSWLLRRISSGQSSGVSKVRVSLVSSQLVLVPRLIWKSGSGNLIGSQLTRDCQKSSKS